VAVIPSKALIFDMDGLMVDSEPLWFEVQGDFVRERGGEWTEELAQACTGGGLRNALEIMGKAFGFAVDTTRDAEQIVESFILRIGKLVPKPGCRELLDAAHRRRLPCAVASSSTRVLVDATLEHLKLRDLFAAVVTVESVARPKPAPDIFLEAAARLGAAPGDCVVLEDSVMGVRAARAAAMTVIAVPETGFERFHGLADEIVSDLHQARALLAI
jgi:mannitol-1-/sugar-/sorbitol-6-/2-deoxyglucose-6-phosphatase